MDGADDMVGADLLERVVDSGPAGLGGTERRRASRCAVSHNEGDVGAVLQVGGLADDLLGPAGMNLTGVVAAGLVVLIGLVAVVGLALVDHQDGRAHGRRMARTRQRQHG